MLEYFLQFSLDKIAPPPFKPEFMREQIGTAAATLSGRKLYLLLSCAMVLIAEHLAEVEEAG